jgi:hypothetical protein
MVLNSKAIEFLERLGTLFQEYNVHDVYYDEGKRAVQIAADDFEFYLVNYDADSGIEVSSKDEEP